MSATDGAVYAGTEPSRLFCSRDGGESWEEFWEGTGPWQMIEGPLDAHVYALATGQGKLFAGLGDGTLLESQDGGESWSDIDERIGGITALAVK